MNVDANKVVEQLSRANAQLQVEKAVLIVQVEMLIAERDEQTKAE